MNALNNAIALLRRIGAHLEEDSGSSFRGRALVAMVTEFVEAPDAPPSEIGNLLDQVHALHVEDGRLDALLQEAQHAFDANRKRISELWQRIEATKGGAE